MKFAAFTVSFLAAANAFTQGPPSFVSRSTSSVSAPTSSNFPSINVRTHDTSLNFFNFGKEETKFPVVFVQDISDEAVKKLFYKWNDALATLDSKKVAQCYARKAVLLPTVSDVPRTNEATITEYFDNFLELKPQGVILESHVMKGFNWAKDVGIYEFTMGASGAKVKARYSFVYVYEDGEWKIAHHHSSMMPEGTMGEKISEEEVRGLFNLWNDALATLDSDTVAKRYSKNPVLLPTVSDTPRTDYATIKNYFDAFLKIKPQGVIAQSNVYIGTNWAQDAGIYDFTMRETGAKVKARYSFIYVYEDGEWKIQHHHSSVMPEGIIPPPQAITETEVRKLFNVWNDALATLDPDTVAKCYSKEAVLLPTVSDTPRTSNALIKDYFTAFLQRKPQGKIVSGNIIVGHNWAQDAGIYEFTMGADGSKVKARYSYIYVFEDGQWKISHHHSSVMPEAFLGKTEPVKEEEKVEEKKVEADKKAKVTTSKK